MAWLYLLSAAAGLASFGVCPDGAQELRVDSGVAHPIVSTQIATAPAIAARAEATERGELT